MPPIRTGTFPAMNTTKLMKTERTHEENQERAYIAASRRSDRSLEARVESARRASEIHKKRTGRSLRVTEQDVINEEMYEEEDDELPMQYRRLTTHLQTTSIDFNRRLAAYLTNQTAMRDALNAAISSTYGPQGNIGTWNPSSQGFQGTWTSNQSHPQQQPMGQPQQAYANQMMNQQMQQSPVDYQSSPFQTATGLPQGAGPPHGRSASVAVPSHTPSHPTTSRSVGSLSPHSQTDASHPVQRSSSVSSAPAAPVTPGNPANVTTAGKSSGQSNSQPMSPQTALLSSQEWQQAQQQVISPFSTSYAPNVQQFFKMQDLDSNGFNGSLKQLQQMPKFQEQPFYSYGVNSFNKPTNLFPSVDGMNQTLAPETLTKSEPVPDWLAQPVKSEDNPVSPFGMSFNHDSHEFNDHDNFAGTLGLSSGQNTPGVEAWNSFLVDDYAEDAIA